MNPKAFPEKTEVLVAGAGPAGLAATRALVQAGVSVMLVDARKKIGHPLRCAELTGLPFFLETGFAPRKDWVRWALKESPGSIVLNRPRMEHEMAQILAEQGAQVRAATSVIGVGPYDGEGRVVTLRADKRSVKVKARLLVAADGVSSRVARLAGIDTSLRLGQVASCFAWRIKGAKLSNPHQGIQEHVPELSPFYFWLVPYGEDEANVGVGVIGSRGHAARLLLEQQLSRSKAISGGQVVETIVGLVPSTHPLARPYSHGVIVVGTAARLIDASLGAGIWQAATSGRVAAEVYLDAPNRSTVDKHLAPYRKQLDKMYRALFGGVLKRMVIEHATRPKRKK